MLSLKTNKGFTLVELLVSMCILAIVMTELMALMFNSSKLYQNGSFEVSLQSEAQQIIQQFEELAIDADTSVSFNEATKTITISNNSPYDSYEFTLSPVAGKPYNDLMLKVNGGTPQLMGEYVKSISLNMANFDDASRAVLMVEMENDKYSYSAAKDIYFRNDIGANDIHTTAVVDEACDYKLNVLRYAQYDLKSLYGNDHIYAFVVDPHTEYSYTGPTMAAVQAATSEITGTCILNTSISMNGTGGDDLEPHYIVQSYKWDSSVHKYVEDFKIEVYSERVSFGMDGYGIAAIPPTSTDTDNYFSIAGVSIAPSDLKSIQFELCCVADVNGAAVTADNVEIKARNGDSDSFSSVTFLSQAWSRNTFMVRSLGTVTGTSNLSGDMTGFNPDGGMRFEVYNGGSQIMESHNQKLFNAKYKIDVENNDFICINNCQFQSGDKTTWYDFVYYYGVFYINVKFRYEGTMAPSGGRTFELRIYPMPLGEHQYSSSVMERFFKIAK